jgi:hypothetical protein
MQTQRIIFSAIVIIHALIHLIGFSREWQIPSPQNFNVKEIILSPTVKLNLTGFLWWICFASLVLTIIFYQLEKDWWWIIAIGAVMLSQTLIVLYWNDAKWGTVVNVILLAAISTSYYQWNFNRMVKSEIHELLSSARDQKASYVTLESIQGLPVIVQKWLRTSNVIGREKVKTVHLKQKGRMRNKPDAKWMNLEADQYITTSVPGFIWKASIDAGYLITIVGRDKYANGHGNMLIKAMSMIPIANGTGKEIDQGTMLRYLAEISWFPDAALNDYIAWESVDAMSAKATMRVGDMTVSGIFSFNDQGHIIGFEGRRYGDFDGKYSLETWSVRITGYKEFNGIRIPNKSEVTWKLSTGNFTWLEVEVTDIDCNITK